MKAFYKSVTIAALALSGTAMAATDGSLGGSSSGTSDVTLIKDNVVQLSNVNDLDLGSHNSLAADLVASDNVCVFNSTSSYRVTVSSANAVFELRNGAASIPYAVTWADSAATPVAVTQGTPLVSQLGDRTSPSCNGATNASFGVTVAAADFNTAGPGNYSDTLTLMIEPE